MSMCRLNIYTTGTCFGEISVYDLHIYTVELMTESEFVIRYPLTAIHIHTCLDL